MPKALLQLKCLARCWYNVISKVFIQYIQTSIERIFTRLKQKMS